MELLKRTLFGASFLAAAATAGGAAAQDGAANFETAASESDVIIVTAQKREERLIDVPIAISALSADDIAERGVTDVQDLSFHVPGLILRYDGPGSTNVFMRGAANIRGSDTLVSTYMDETPVTLTGGFRQVDLRMLDIERVEVLKGPQGTLYGQGAMAGTVRFVTANPNLTDVEGFVTADYSVIEDGADNAKLSGAISVPIVEDVLAMRFAGAWEDGGGWIDQPGRDIEDGNNQDINNFRFKMLFTPTQEFSLMATVGFYQMNSEFGLGYENEDRTRPVPLSPDFDLLPPREDRAEIYNLTAAYDFGFATLTSSSSYVRLDRDYTLTYIAGPGTPYSIQNEGFDGNHDRAHQFTQELRLSSSGDTRLQYTVGAYYRDAESNLYDEGISYYDGGVYPFVYQDVDTSESVSLFLDASYAFTDRLRVGAGVRAFQDDVTQWNGGVTQTETFESTDPRVYFIYDLAPDWTLYGNAGRGFRSGGFNTAGLPAYSPEHLTSFEIGTKGVAAGGDVLFDFAIFHSIYEDALRTGQFFNHGSGGGFVSYTRNIGEIEVTGVEGSVDWRATPDLTLSIMAAYTDSEVTELSIASGETTNVEVGDPGDYAPEWTLALAANYEFTMFDVLPSTFHVDYTYRDETCASDSSILVPRTQCSDQISLVNARIGTDVTSDMRVELYVNNVTNENLEVDPYAAWQQSSRTKPRTVGVVVSRTF